jgi:hypothetical protein
MASYLKKNGINMNIFICTILYNMADEPLSGCSLFQDSKLKLMKGIYDEFVAPHEASLPATENEGLQRVCSGKKYTLFASWMFLIYYADELNCTIVPVPQTSFPTITSFATVKMSPYRRLFSYR